MLKGVHQKLEPQESPAFFVRGPSPFSRMVFFCALSIVLMAIDSRLNYLTQFRQTFIATLHPLEMIANAPSEWGLNIRHYFTAHGRLLAENQALKLEAVEHKVMLQRLQTIELENSHLRTLLKGNAPIIPKAILGEILHMGRDPFSNVIVINRGSQHDVKAGQAVVDAEGVVGQVTRVFPFSAEVTLITDDNLSIPIQVERNQLRAIAFGEGKSNTIDLPFLPTSVDIQVGDRLVTSGIDGVYPAGLAVAKVTQVRQSPDSPFAKIVSTPIAGVNNHLQLLILSLPEAEENTVVAEQKKSIAPPVTASNNAIQPNQATPNAPR
ncbi:MAG: rod shape-determining protein MreC [Methylophilales bacterium 28-44-11]|jgi:rod shape-determining protein MreC|nr:MAG: rod shape-determining protein MreC [Methylophilales bacterium 28-44-11]